MDITLLTYMNEMVRQTPREFKRYLYGRIDWNNRLIGIVGPRGVGKSTMLLQHLIDNGIEDALYVSADSLYFTSHTLVDVADEFVRNNGKRLYIDEIHKYPNWSREIKQIYDVHRSLKVIFTGSSILDIKKGFADLSRRMVHYSLQGLSFREYLELFHSIVVPTYSLEDILTRQITIPGLEHPLPVFKKYLLEGYYPFALEGSLHTKLLQVVDRTIEVDIAQYAALKANTARKLKHLLAIISGMAPFKPVASTLAKTISVSAENIPTYLTYLDSAAMIALLHDDTAGLYNLRKIEKAYIDNPTLMTALAAGSPDTGSLRETFFYNQMRVNHDITASRTADFRIGDMVFEIGGRNKGQRQIKGADHGFVVKDDIEFGTENIIPLWCFGLNY